MMFYMLCLGCGYGIVMGVLLWVLVKWFENLSVVNGFCCFVVCVLIFVVVLDLLVVV